jgi:RHS repeat-associated protein
VFVPRTPEVYEYDDDGNLLNDGRWEYTWNGENQLAGVETSALAVAAGAPKQRLTFEYNFMGRRISKKVENWKGSSYNKHHKMVYLYDGWNLAAEMLEGGQKIRSYVWGSDLSGGEAAGGIRGALFIEQEPEGKTYSVGYDGNGNVTRLIEMGDATTTAASYEYGPFGELIEESGPYAQINPVRWSTKYEDPESGQVYYGYRYYNPETGRWLNRDLIGEQGGMNLYGSTSNDLVNRIDPLGLEELFYLQMAVDFTRGAGDSLSFGLTAVAREYLYGENGSVQYQTAYHLGSRRGLSTILNKHHLVS